MGVESPPRLKECQRGIRIGLSRFTRKGFRVLCSSARRAREGMMMKQLLWGAASALALTSVASAQDDKGFYAELLFGYGGPTERKIENVFGSTDSAELDAEFDMRFGGGLGYAFGNGWRIEAEVVDRFNDTGALEFNGVPAAASLVNTGDLSDSSINSVAILGNVIRDLDTTLPFDIDPYIGAGVGTAQTRFAMRDGVNAIVNDEWGWAAQAFVGLGIPLTERLTADLEGRYFVTADNDILLGSLEQRLDEPSSFDVLLGLRYSFGPRAERPQRSAPPAPPAAAANNGQAAIVCDDVPFIVYFGWDSDVVTDQARRVISNAADQAAECDITRVQIEGHTDRSGSTSYNVDLSRRRANNVRSALISEGVPASVITTSARGESEPQTDTPDGVREPLNRRSEVLIEVE